MAISEGHKLVELPNPPAYFTEKPQTDPLSEKASAEVERLFNRNASSPLTDSSFPTEVGERKSAIQFAIAQLESERQLRALGEDAVERTSGQSFSECDKSGRITTWRPAGENRATISVKYDDDNSSLITELSVARTGSDGTVSTSLYTREGRTDNWSIITVTKDRDGKESRSAATRGELSFSLDQRGYIWSCGVNDYSVQTLDGRSFDVKREVNNAKVELLRYQDGTVFSIRRPDGSGAWRIDDGKQEKLQIVAPDNGQNYKSTIWARRPESGWVAEDTLIDSAETYPLGRDGAYHFSAQGIFNTIRADGSCSQVELASELEREFSSSGTIQSVKLGDKEWNFSCEENGVLTGLLVRSGNLVVSSSLPPGSQYRLLPDGKIGYLHPGGANVLIAIDGKIEELSADGNVVATGQLLACGAAVFKNQNGESIRILRQDGSSISTDAGNVVFRRTDGASAVWQRKADGWHENLTGRTMQRIDLGDNGVTTLVEQNGRRAVVLGSGAVVQQHEKFEYKFDSQGRVTAITAEQPSIAQLSYYGDSTMLQSCTVQNGSEQNSFVRVAGKNEWKLHDLSGKEIDHVYCDIQFRPTGYFGFRNTPIGQPAQQNWRVFIDNQAEVIESSQQGIAAVYHDISGNLLYAQRQDGSQVVCHWQDGKQTKIVSSNAQGETLEFVRQQHEDGSSVWRANGDDIVATPVSPLSNDGVMSYRERDGGRHITPLSGLKTVIKPNGEQLLYNLRGDLDRIFSGGRLREFNRNSSGVLESVVDTTGLHSHAVWHKNGSGESNYDQQQGVLTVRNLDNSWTSYYPDFSSQVRIGGANYESGLLSEVKLADGSQRNFEYADGRIIAIVDKSAVDSETVTVRWELDTTAETEKVFTATLPDGSREERLIEKIEPDGSYYYRQDDNVFFAPAEHLAVNHHCKIDKLGRVAVWSRDEVGAPRKYISYKGDSDQITEVRQVAILPEQQTEIRTFRLSDEAHHWQVQREVLEAGQVVGEGKVEQLEEYIGVFKLTPISFGAALPNAAEEISHIIRSNGEICYERLEPNGCLVVTNAADYLVERRFSHQATLQIERDDLIRMTAIRFFGVGATTGKAGQILISRSENDQLSIAGKWDGKEFCGDLDRLTLTEKGAVTFKTSDGERFRITETGEFEQIAQHGAQFEFLSTIVEKAREYPNLVDVEGVVAAMAQLEERVENLGLYREHNRSGTLEDLNQSLESMYQHYTALLNAPYDNGTTTAHHAIVAQPYRVKLVEYAIHMMARPSVINQNPFPWCSCASVETSLTYNVRGYAEMLYSALCSVPFQDANGRQTSFKRQNSINFIDQGVRVAGANAANAYSWPSIDQLDKRGIVSPLSSLQQGSINRIGFVHYGARNETTKRIDTNAMAGVARAVSGRPVPLLFQSPSSVSAAARYEASGRTSNIGERLKQGNGILFVAGNHAQFGYVLPKMIDGKWTLLYAENNTWGKRNDKFTSDPHYTGQVLTPDKLFNEFHASAKASGDPFVFWDGQMKQ